MRDAGRWPWALIAFFVLSLPMVTYRIRGADEIEYFSYLRSMAFDRNLDFENEYRHFYERDPHGLAGFKSTFLDLRDRRTGRPINFAPAGSALLWAPFYGIAHVGVIGSRALGSDVPADGYSQPYVVAVSLASALYAFAGLWCLYVALVGWGHCSTGVASTVVVALWAGTPLLYYTTIAPTFSHACSVFATSLLLWRWLAWRAAQAPWLWLALGALGGLAGMVREQDLFLLCVPAADAALQGVRGRNLLLALRRLSALVCGAFVAFAPQLLVYHALNGGFGPSRHVADKMSFSSPHFFEVLAHPGHGWFLWTPLALAALIGLGLAAWKGRREIVVPLMLGALTQVWLNGSVESWSQAGAFGARRFLSLTFVLGWGLAPLIVTGLRRWGRAATAFVLVILVWWNLSLMIQFGLRLMDRQRLEWPRVAINQVTEVPPRLWRTIRLFLTDRERLVQESR